MDRTQCATRCLAGRAGRTGAPWVLIAVTCMTAWAMFLYVSGPASAYHDEVATPPPPAPASNSPFLADAPPLGSPAVPGGPPPVGRTAPSTAQFSYNGVLIEPNDAATAGLSCFAPSTGTTRCYATLAAMARAEHFANPAQYRTPAARAAFRRTILKMKKGRQKNAKAANHVVGWPYLLYQHAGYAGWNVATNSYCQWFDLTGFYGGNASSLDAGQHSAYGSTGYGGGGSVAGFSAWASVSNLLSWNDRFYSRSRACL